MMKKLKTKKTANLFWMVFVVVLPLLGACEKEGEEMDESGTVSLSTIPQKSAYASLPLIGTTWQLIGYVNTGTGRVKKVELLHDHSYTLIFEDADKINGFIRSPTGGEYELFKDEPSKISISAFGLLANIIPNEEESEYIQTMTDKVNRFTITSQGLCLHYGTHDYLLYRPLL